MRIDVPTFKDVSQPAREAIARAITLHNIMADGADLDKVLDPTYSLYDATANVRRALMGWKVPELVDLPCRVKTSGTVFLMILRRTTPDNVAKMLPDAQTKLLDAIAFRNNLTSRARTWAMMGVVPETGRDMITRHPSRLTWPVFFTMRSHLLCDPVGPDYTQSVN
jgi:hypothetical protein